MTLNPAFLSEVAPLLGDALPAFTAAMQAPAVRGLRLNPKYAPELFPDLLGPVPWAENGFYLSPDSRLGQSAAHEAGAFYMQEPSAMAPAEALDVQPDDLVLDLCAAPGGKTTQLARKLTRGTLVANEIHPGRARILAGNVERLGLKNVIVTSAPPEKLSRQWPLLFDRVLTDAPCSGEGMFRKNPAAMEEWQPSSPSGCARRQRDILACAVSLLRPGGTLVYSTCTFNRLENEDQAEWLIQEYPELEMSPFALPGLPPAADGLLRLWPHEVRGEGHFAARFRKKDGPLPARDPRSLPRPDRGVLARADEALESLIYDPPRDIRLFGELLLVPPSFVPDLAGLTVLRLGLSLGRFQGKTFLPDHALSRACRPLRTFPVDEQGAAAYLHGEALPASENERGFGVVTADGFPLGWGKASDGQIKNHYPKGLRR